MALKKILTKGAPAAGRIDSVSDRAEVFFVKVINYLKGYANFLQLKYEIMRTKKKTKTLTQSPVNKKRSASLYIRRVRLKSEWYLIM